MSQLPLFARARGAIDVPGLTYVEGYVSAADERALAAAVDREPWIIDWRRRVQRYGAAYGASARGARDAPPIPTWLAPLAARLARDGHLDGDAASVVINEYEPGQGIAAHRDYAPFGDAVAAVSLLAPCVVDFADPDSDARRAIDVAPRSLYVFRGDARWRWTHGIAPRKADVIDGAKRPRARRLSITFRTLRR